MKAAPDSSVHSVTKRALAAAIGAVLFLAGVVVGRTTGRAAHTYEHEGPAGTSSSVEDALEALRGELRSLRASLAAAPLESPRASATSREREPVADATASAEDERRFEKALLQLERAAARVQAPTTPASPGRHSLADIVLEYRTRGGTDEGLDALNDELTAAHMLWTVDDVVARYGLPRDVSVSRQTPSIRCVYAFPGDASAEPEPAVCFLLVSGRVTYAAVEE